MSRARPRMATSHTHWPSSSAASTAPPSSSDQGLSGARAVGCSGARSVRPGSCCGRRAPFGGASLCHVVVIWSTIPVRHYVHLRRRDGAGSTADAGRRLAAAEPRAVRTGCRSGAAGRDSRRDAARLGVARRRRRRATPTAASPSRSRHASTTSAMPRNDRRAGRGTPRRRPRWRRSARWARRPCAARARGRGLALGEHGLRPGLLAPARGSGTVAVSGRSKVIAVANRSSRRTCGSGGRSG